jgi:hypothetical protein
VRESPPVLSPEAPRTFLRDAIRGLTWLLRRTANLLQGRQPVHPGAFGVGQAATPAYIEIVVTPAG